MFCVPMRFIFVQKIAQNPMNKLYFFLLLAACMCCSMSLSAQKANAGADREICLYDTLKVTGSGLNPGDTGTYRWRDINTNSVLSLNENLVVKILSISTREYELRLLLNKNGQNIVTYDTFTLKVNNLPSFQWAGLPPRCYNDGPIFLTANCVAKAFSGDKTRNSCNVRYYQSKSPSWISGAPSGPYVYDFTKYIQNAQIPKSGARDSICYDFTDYKGCYNKECMAVRLNPNPEVQLNNAQFAQCNGEPLLNNLAVKPFIKAGGIQIYRCLSVPAGSGINPDSAIRYNSSVAPAQWTLKSGTVADTQKAGTYVIEYCFKDAITGCMTCDTATVDIIKIAGLYLAPLPKSCINDTLLMLDTMARSKDSGLPYTKGKWSCVEFNGSRDRSMPSVAAALNNSIVNGNRFNPGISAGVYMLKFTDTTSLCPQSDSALLVNNGLPLISIDVPDTVAFGDTVDLNNIAPAGPVGNWYGPGVSGRRFHTSISPQTKMFEGPYKVVFEYVHPLTGCRSSDSDYLMVQSLPEVAIMPQLSKPDTAYKADFTGSLMKHTNSSLQSCRWEFGNGSVSTLFNPGIITYADSGTYRVRLAVWDSRVYAADSIDFTFDYRISSTEFVQLLSGISIYPNPASDLLMLMLPGDAACSVYNQSGQAVMSGIPLQKGLNSLALGHLPAGIYTLRISLPGLSVSRRLLLEK